MAAMLKCLRIAVTAVSLTACVLLVALWVRTKYAIDSFGGPLSASKAFYVMSRHGGIGLLLAQWNSEWMYLKYPADEFVSSEFEMEIGYKTALGFVQYVKDPGAFRIRVPYWSLVSLSAVFAAIPWLRWRFSLRTLMIGTTLVAVWLGVVAMSR
jgi:hypothetical protein